jgi:hypothetical protein
VDEARWKALGLVKMAEFGKMGCGEMELVRDVEKRISALTGLPLNRHESGLTLNHTRATSDEISDKSICGKPTRLQQHRLPLGLHLDINNGKPYRAVTVLVYLNSVDDDGGGETVFPCASDGAARMAGHTLFNEGYPHTTSEQGLSKVGAAAAATLLAAGTE